MRLKRYLTEAELDLDNILKNMTLPPGEKNYVIKWVKANPFDKAWSKDRDFYVGPGGSGASIGSRYKRFISFLANYTGKIETPIVYVDDDGKVSFSNGRHRFAVLRDLGAEKIPVGLYVPSIKNAKKFGYI